MIESFPLKWPMGRQRHSKYQRKPAPFKTTPGRARDELLAELRRLGARDVIISSNVATYRRGGQDIMYADQSASKEDPGVAVYYTWNGEQYALACDRYQTVTDNLQALNKTVNAIRGIERWGTGEMMKAAFAGFKELPGASPATAAKPQARQWYEVLNVSPYASETEVRAAYRRLAFVHHPDRGGSAEKFNEIAGAYEIGLSKFRNS